MEERIKTALEFLKDGQSFQIGELRLTAEHPNIIEIEGWSNYTDFKNLRKRQCIEELAEIKKLFQEMLDVSLELQAFVKNKVLKFNLYYDDYGKGSILICSEKNGIIEWEENID